MDNLLYTDISIFYTVQWDEIMLIQCYRQWYVAGNDGRISVEGNPNRHLNPQVYMWMTKNKNIGIYTTEVVLTVPICWFIFIIYTSFSSLFHL